MTHVCSMWVSHFLQPAEMERHHNSRKVKDNEPDSLSPRNLEGFTGMETL